MNDVAIRREINELRTLYLLKPHFRDVVVEGRDDAAWLTWYLREHGARNLKVVAVDDLVTVPRDLVSVVHREINARGRVVALASECEKWNLPQNSLTCVVDSDFDLYESSLSSSVLLKTDYAAMEVYALESRPLAKFLVASAKSNIAASQVTALLKPAWAVLYALRYVLHNHADGARLASRYADRCVTSAGEVIADARDLLMTASPTPSRETLEELLSLHCEYVAKLPMDTLDGIRGHDIAPLLIRFLGLKNDLAGAGHVERLLRQSIELCDLDDQSLFADLRGRVL